MRQREGRIPAPRLYSDLSWLWPAWEDSTLYAHWCAFVSGLLLTHTRGGASTSTLLHLGCGGGKSLYHLATQFDVTGVDLSPTMLALAREASPGSEVILDDMVTCDLGRTFDAVLIDDAVSYVLDADDLETLFRNAHRHLRPGGALVVTADVTAETLVSGEARATTLETEMLPEGIEAAVTEWLVDPDPEDTTYECEIVFAIREGGELRVETDRHVLGVFPRRTWVDAMRRAGFANPQELEFVEFGGESTHATFVGVRS